jgi:hypothetical protein
MSAREKKQEKYDERQLGEDCNFIYDEAVNLNC